MTAPPQVARYALSEDASYEVTGGSTIVLRVSDGQLFTGNAVTACVLEELAHAPTAAELEATFAARFEADPGVIRADLARILDEFARERLVVRLDVASGEGVPEDA